VTSKINRGAHYARLVARVQECYSTTNKLYDHIEKESLNPDGPQETWYVISIGMKNVQIIIQFMNLNRCKFSNSPYCLGCITRKLSTLMTATIMRIEDDNDPKYITRQMVQWILSLKLSGHSFDALNYMIKTFWQ
jgi:hypothetical protein